MFFTTGMTTGGAERVIATLSNWLASEGHQVTVAMIKGEKSEYYLAEAIELTSAQLEPGLVNLPKALRFYRRTLNRVKPDVVISFLTKADIIAILARALYREKTPLIVSDRQDPYTRSFAWQFLCNRLYPKADRLVCQSQAAARYYRENAPKTSLEVIENPLNVSAIAQPAADPREPYIFTAGRLSPEKDQALALRAFSLISRERPELEFRIYGSGPLEAELQGQIERLELDSRVKLCGTIPDVIRENRAAAAFLFTSAAEGFPNALLEAAASGIPCVSTNFSPGTATEIIADGENGYVVGSRSEQDIAAALLKVLDGELSVGSIDRGATRLRETHSLEPIATRWRDLCEALVASR